MGPVELPDRIEVAASITGVLEGLGVRYLIGGSLASSVHMNAAVKVDIFLAGEDPFNRERPDARQAVQLPTEPEIRVYVDTAEHSVLRKLEWFRRGGEVSERQWRDVVAILRLQGSRLDQSRLSTWAPRLGVADLLDRAFQEAAEAG